MKKYTASLALFLVCFIPVAAPFLPELSPLQSPLFTTIFPGLGALFRDAEEKLQVISTPQEMAPFYDLVQLAANIEKYPLFFTRKVTAAVLRVKKVIPHEKSSLGPQKAALAALVRLEKPIVQARDALRATRTNETLRRVLTCKRPSYPRGVTNPPLTDLFPFILELATTTRLALLPYMTCTQASQFDLYVQFMQKKMESVEKRVIQRGFEDLWQSIKSNPVTNKREGAQRAKILFQFGSFQQGVEYVLGLAEESPSLFVTESQKSLIRKALKRRTRKIITALLTSSLPTFALGIGGTGLLSLLGFSKISWALRILGSSVGAAVVGGISTGTTALLTRVSRRMRTQQK